MQPPTAAKPAVRTHGEFKQRLNYMLENLESLGGRNKVIGTGEHISLPEGALLGHGLIECHDPVENDDTEEGALQTAFFVTLTGSLTCVNSLTYVAPLYSKYVPETGDVVVGRIIEVAQGRWSVDINASLPGKLMLTSIALPSGEQRRKTDAEIVDMRQFFSEDDLVFTEVQKVNNDRSCNLHTRNARYGKLYNGCVVSVPATLIKRLSQHSFLLHGDVYIVLGNNGYVWVGSKPETNRTDTLNFVECTANRYVEVTPDVRRRISRVRNSILLLASLSLLICPESLMAVYNATTILNLPSSYLLDQQLALRILRTACTVGPLPA